MLYKRVRVWGVSGKYYSFQLCPLDEFDNLNQKVIYILVKKDVDGNYHYIYMNKTTCLKTELLTKKLQAIILKNNPTHLLIKEPFSKTSLDEQWEDIRLLFRIFT